MPTKTFIETNVLVYAHDVQAGPKQAIAAKALQGHWKERSGVLSLQVLQEFYVTLTQKIPQPLSLKAAQNILKQYGYWEVAILEVDDLHQAIELQKNYRFSFWDALIVQAALKTECQELLSEDFQAGQKVESLLIRNPFS